jgi:uncharacterized protein (DUF58 family)
MRATFAYTSARILLLVVSVILLYLVGARGLLLLALAFLVSGILSFVLLSRQRDVMSSALMARIMNGRQRAAEFRARIEEGAQAEDEDLELPGGRADADHQRRRPGHRRLCRPIQDGGQPPNAGLELRYGIDRLVPGHG